ncbi:MAG TPA: hypothetical protein VIJ62_08955 [Rhizomicrobium sp.]
MTEKEEAALRQEVIRSHANTSIAILEKAFIRNGSGRYLTLRTDDLGLALRAVGLFAADDTKIP